jgi:hypothetical protein
VVPDAFNTFFAASAGVAGALIGLLFVAISVAPELPKGESRIQMDIRAGVAFSVLTDALVVSLFALIPGTQMGQVAVVVAGVGLATCLGLGVVLARTPAEGHRLRQVRMLVTQAAVFVLQLLVGLRVDSHPHNVSNIRSLAVLTVVFFVVGIGRAWQLIGARETGLLHVVGNVLRGGTATVLAAPAPGGQPSPEAGASPTAGDPGD